jgi:hypothetical protein
LGAHSRAHRAFHIHRLIRAGIQPAELDQLLSPD